MEKPAFENVLLEADESIRVLQYSCPAFQSNHTWHFHPQYEISLILKGTGKRFIGDHIGTFAPGDMVLIGPNVPHCWISENEHTENEMLVVQFDPRFLGEAFYNIPEAHAIKSLLSASRQAALFHLSESHNEIYEWVENVRVSRGLARIAHFLLLCQSLSEADREQLTSDDYIVEQSVRGVDRLTNAINYVKNHLQEEIKQPEVAKLVNMAPQSFSRFFRAQTGRTFVSFVNEVRITEACHLLATTDRDILDIALSCGYANISHFNRKFLENKKLTPSRFRENQRLKMGYLKASQSQELET
jgi:AraC-like DNA-binding protein/quercetin dioxygenase-like cupin family protein